MFVITQSCCSDAACVAVCPVNCIHPTPEERGFGTSDILHVDPQACIDCGACADACPVNAIYPADKLGTRDKVFIDINADYYKSNPDIQSGYAPTGAELPGMAPFPDVVAARPSSYTTDDDWPGVTYPEIPKLPVGLRIALVGTGPSGGYALRTLLDRTEADITVAVETDREPLELPTAPFGDTERRIAAHLQDLIPDRATLQAGMFAMPPDATGMTGASEAQSCSKYSPCTGFGSSLLALQIVVVMTLLSVAPSIVTMLENAGESRCFGARVGAPSRTCGRTPGWRSRSRSRWSSW